jgi:hypothetical protein
MSGTLSNVLSVLPVTLRDELFESLNSIERNFREGRWEPSELNGGKLCEIVYSILKGHVDGSFPAKASKPPNIVDACRALEQASQGFSRSVRIQIPRMLVALYEIRNNRGVGHVGGDVNPNHMDAICVLQMSKWLVAELVRVFHNVSTEDASAIVDTLSDRELALIWKVGEISRVLDTSMSMSDKALVLLYGAPKGVIESELVISLEHSNASIFRRDVLKRLHKKRWIEYNQFTRLATISPLGSRHVEETILARSSLQ